MLSREALRERALRKAAEELAPYAGRAGDATAGIHALPCMRETRMERLRTLLRLIDEHQGEFSDSIVRYLAWKYYETEETVWLMILLRDERKRAREERGKLKAKGGERHGAQEARGEEHPSGAAEVG